MTPRAESYAPFAERIQAIIRIAKRGDSVRVYVAPHTIYAFPANSALVKDIKRHAKFVGEYGKNVSYKTLFHALHDKITGATT